MLNICCQSIWNSSNTKEKLWDSWVLSASVWVARSPVDFCYATTEAERRPLLVSVPIPLRTQRAKAPTRRKVFLLNYGNQKNSNKYLSQSLLTYLLQTALLTISFSCGTYFSAMINKAVAEVASLLAGNDFPESHLYLLRVFDAVHESHPVCKADAVCIGNNCRLSKNIAHNQVGALSSDTGEF